MNKSMKLVTVVALGLGIFQNFGAEAVKVVSVDCPKGLCVVKGSDGNLYALDEGSKKAIYEAMMSKEFKELDSKLTGTVKVNGKSVPLSFEKQQDDSKPAQPK
ncbi:MAG: hypothetical protein K2Y08_07005 [Alphaproteobacteria bacterium]|nr:hypothetical protein [Alphaproteobacteria bacterium]